MQIDARRGDVLAEVSRRDVEPLCHQLLEEFGTNEVHLAEVRLRRVDSNTRPVAHRRSAVGVAVDAETGNERRLLLRLLRERMSRAEVQGDDKSGHAVESDTPIPPAVGELTTC